MIKLFRFLKPYKIPLLVVFILAFLQSIAELYMPTLMSDIVNDGITNKNLSFILKTGGFMLLVTLVAMICSMTTTFLAAQIAMGFGKILRSKIFRHITSFSLYEFDQLGTSSLITRNTNDVTQIQTFTMYLLQPMSMAPIMCFGSIIMAITKDKYLAWIIIPLMPLLLITFLTVARKAFPLFQGIQAKIDQINLILREGLGGIRVIRTFNRVNYERERFRKANLDLTETAIKVNQLMILLLPLMSFIWNLTTIMVIWVGSMRVNIGKTNIGDLMAFLQYALQIFISLNMAATAFMMLPRVQACANRINEVFAINPEITDPEYIKSSGNKKGYLEFKNVNFSYHGAEEPALKNISFSAGPGEVTAIIGGTGSGKSTLVNLILRFYDVDNGSIEIDGIDIRQMSLEALRTKIGLAPQKAVLFSGSIMHNIKFGLDEMTEPEIEHAAKIAQASEFINNMRDGYHSTVAQGGANVSGGQKQRLAIARAIVRKPEIFIFDDSFSALDFKTDARLRAALKKETAGATVLIIGQRIATIMDADRIIVLDNGQISGIGTHLELSQTCKIYQEIVSTQFAAEKSNLACRKVQKTIR